MTNKQEGNELENEFDHDFNFDDFDLAEFDSAKGEGFEHEDGGLNAQDGGGNSFFADENPAAEGETSDGSTLDGEDWSPNPLFQFDETESGQEGNGEKQFSENDLIHDPWADSHDEPPETESPSQTEIGVGGIGDPFETPSDGETGIFSGEEDYQRMFRETENAARKDIPPTDAAKPNVPLGNDEAFSSPEPVEPDAELNENWLDEIGEINGEADENAKENRLDMPSDTNGIPEQPKNFPVETDEPKNLASLDADASFLPESQTDSSGESQDPSLASTPPVETGLSDSFHDVSVEEFGDLFKDELDPKITPGEAPESPNNEPLNLDGPGEFFSQAPGELEDLTLESEDLIEPEGTEFLEVDQVVDGGRGKKIPENQKPYEFDSFDDSVLQGIPKDDPGEIVDGLSELQEEYGLSGSKSGENLIDLDAIEPMPFAGRAPESSKSDETEGRERIFRKYAYDVKICVSAPKMYGDEIMNLKPGHVIRTAEWQSEIFDLYLGDQLIAQCEKCRESADRPSFRIVKTLI